MEAVGIGDLHFDGPVSNLVDNFHDQIVKEIKKVLKWAEKRGINNVFLYGDVCEHPRMTHDSYLAFLKLLYESSDFNFYIILGNHDLFAEDPSQGHSLELLEVLINAGALQHVQLFTQVTDVEIDGAKVRFLPWPHINFSKSRLNVAHIEVEGSKGDFGKKFQGEKFSASKSLVVSGHLHLAHKIRNTYYSGTLYQNKFGEKKDRFFHHIEFNGIDDYSVSLIPFEPDYTLHNIVIESRKDLKRIPTNPKQLVKLIVESTADVDHTSWSKFTNIVKTKSYKTEAELVESLTEDLTDGQSLKFNIDDFFEAWAIAQQDDQDLVQRMIAARQRIVKRK